MRPVTRLFQIAFMQMDIFSQIVLFAYLQLKNKKDSIFEERANSFLIKQIFNRKKFIDTHNIQQGIQTIKQHRFIEEYDELKIIIEKYCLKIDKKITATNSCLRFKLELLEQPIINKSLLIREEEETRL